MADLSITATEVLAGAGADTENGIAGEALTAGQVVYKLSTDKKFYKADCDSAGKTSVYGIALNGAAAGQPVSVQKSGSITIGATAAPTVGEIYVLSGTAGGIAPEADLASGDTVSILGVGESASSIQLRINNTGVVVPA